MSNKKTSKERDAKDKILAELAEMVREHNKSRMNLAKFLHDKCYGDRFMYRTHQTKGITPRAAHWFLGVWRYCLAVVKHKPEKDITVDRWMELEEEYIGKMRIDYAADEEESDKLSGEVYNLSDDLRKMSKTLENLSQRL